jgi:DNA-binding response OmpR family regulator
MVKKILVFEDEPTLQETLAYNLKLEGYQVEVVGNGLNGLHTAKEWKPELILLDVMLPGMNGFEVCKLLRPQMDIPILMLTAKADEVDRVVGFEIGADDYITKPFSMRELMARIRTRLRIHAQSIENIHLKEDQPDAGDAVQTYDNLEIDTRRHEVRLEGKPVQLKPKEYELLSYLTQNQGRAVTREMILEQVWGWSYIGNDRTVDVHIRWLRSKIEAKPSQPTRILTVPGVGYRFEG